MKTTNIYYIVDCSVKSRGETAIPIDTQNRHIIALRKPPTKSYATSRKVVYVVLSAPFKRTKNEKEFGIQAEFFLLHKNA